MFGGIDIGGTNIKYGIINDQGEILQHYSVPTQADQGKDALIERLQSIITKLSAETTSIGIGFPSVVNPRDGCIYHPPNLPGWGIVPLTELLSSVSSVPLIIDNDANVAALAESELGAGKDASHFLYITLGTGVGGGLIVDNHIFTGERGGAGEVGHIIIDIHDTPEQGKKNFQTGTLEEKIGRAGLLRLAKLTAERYPTSLLHAENLDVKDISDAAHRNDEAALECLSVAGRLLGYGLCSMLVILDMRVVVVGGGVSLSHPIFMETARNVVKERAFPTIAPEIELRLAKFGSTAGLVGAAMLGKKYARQ